MLEQLIHALIETKNEAADDLLLEALQLGTEPEKTLAVNTLIKRQTTHGLTGIIAQSESLSEALQAHILRNIKNFHHALRECGRSEQPERRLAAMRLITLGRQGKLAYILSENMHDLDPVVSKAAVEALLGLAEWIATETRRLREMGKPSADRPLPVANAESATAAAPSTPAATPTELAPQNGSAAREMGKPSGVPLANLAATYRDLIDNRSEIEHAIARALDVHRGPYVGELLRAALLLCDSPGSKTLAILHTVKHGGQTPMVRRLQQPPTADCVPSYLLGASHGGLRSHFGLVFSHIHEAEVLDGLLRQTHWLKDQQLQICVHQVTRGVWWSDAELQHDIEPRNPRQAAQIGCWLAVSGLHDVTQDERLTVLLKHAEGDFPARLNLLRIVCQRPRTASVQLIRTFLTDPDERLVRIAAREIIRRRPADYENMLLQLMTSVPDSVRRIVGRVVGQASFDLFWTRFSRLDRSTRKQAGRAMMKILPDASQRISRRMLAGPLEQRLKAMQITQELNLAESLGDALVHLCQDADPRIRSKAIQVIGGIPAVGAEVILERVLNDTDARVRANAIEVLEDKRKTEYLPLLTQRARAANNRERANAIKAMHRMHVQSAVGQLQLMLADERPEHRISAMWALKQIGWWQLLQEVGRLAKEDRNLKVRRYALGVLRGVAEIMQPGGVAV